MVNAVVAEIRESGGVAEASYGNLVSREACEELVSFALTSFGRVDILIQNAAIVSYEAIQDLDPIVWERMLKVNVEAPFWLSRTVLPAMRKRGYGRIVFTTSGVAIYPEAAMPGLTAYAVGKAAQFGLMNALTAEVGGSDIRVNAISPVAATRMFRRPADPGTLLPEQVAPGVAFLASSLCQFSGVVLRASGGKFSIGRYGFTQEVDLGSTPTPEDVAERWKVIAGGPLVSGL